MPSATVTVPAPRPSYPGPEDTALGLVSRVLYNLRYGFAMGGSGVHAAIRSTLALVVHEGRHGPSGTVHDAPWGLVTIDTPSERRLEELEAAIALIARDRSLDRSHCKAAVMLTLEAIEAALIARASPWQAASWGDLRYGDRVRVYAGDFDRHEGTITLNDGRLEIGDAPRFVTDPARSHELRFERRVAPEWVEEQSLRGVTA